MIPEPEVQAILALCHHGEGPFHSECEACLFRQEVAVEHLRALIGGLISSLEGGAK